ncbi:MAG: bifunctional hydroxymethylpyrimidine kinase/phosphomethylpyrimidine kinase [Pyrinomonadaceae bacterium]
MVDPVVRSTSGFDLIDDEALSALVTHLFPLAAVVTPNIPEAERLTHLKITNVEDMERAAKRIRELGATAVLVKGGHLPGQPIDVLDDRGQVTHYEGQRIASTSTHGTGCTLAAAIAACLARGKTLHAAVDIAKRFVTDAIKDAPGLGHGSGPVQHNTNSDRFFVDS